MEGDEEQHSLRLAARVGDGWCGAGSPALMRHEIQLVNNYCKAMNTNSQRMQHAWVGYVLTARGKFEIRKKMDSIKRLNPMYPLDRAEFLLENLIGLPVDLKSKVREFVDVGVNYFAIFFLGYPSTDSMKIFAHEVLIEIRS